MKKNINENVNVSETTKIKAPRKSKAALTVAAEPVANTSGSGMRYSRDPSAVAVRLSGKTTDIIQQANKAAERALIAGDKIGAKRFVKYADTLNKALVAFTA